MALDVKEALKGLKQDSHPHVGEHHPHNLKMHKMHRQDTWILVFQIVSLWVCLALVYYTILQVAQDYSRILSLGIGIALGIFATVALLACRVHLTTNKRSLYLTDIEHQRESSGIMKYFDIVFILLLCYISLLLPIILRGTVLVGSGEASGMNYDFNPPLLGAVIVTAVGYLFFMLRNSDKEMRKVYNKVYGPKEEKE